jgi:hypothetical protein
MAIETQPALRKPLDPHRLEMIRLMEEIDARAGIVGDPEISAREIRDRMRAQGVRPEDNAGSRELMRMRYGDDWEEE